MHAQFTESCRGAFRFLIDDFGFDEPLVESIGREVFVQYHKGLNTVSVACEWGLNPIVELFFQAKEGEEPLAWAAKGGALRARRIPHLKTSVSFEHNDSATFGPFLSEQARELGRVELEWLEALNG